MPVASKIVLVWAPDEDHAAQARGRRAAETRWPGYRVRLGNASAFVDRHDQIVPASIVYVDPRYPQIVDAYTRADVSVFLIPDDEPAVGTRAPALTLPPIGAAVVPPTRRPRRAFPGRQ